MKIPIPDLHAKLLRRVPCRFVDQSDLPPSALIGIVDDSASGDELRLIDAVHRAAMGALDPDGYDLPHVNGRC